MISAALRAAPGDDQTHDDRLRLKTARERAEEKREAKLESVREQVESGTLVIRQMTDEERRQYPPRPPRPKRGEKRWA